MFPGRYRIYILICISIYREERIFLPKTVIVDGGRSLIKTLHCRDRLAFPAVIAPGREFQMPVKENDPLRAMHVTIKGGPEGFPEGEYFVGELAIQQARGEATQKRDRQKINKNNLVLSIAAASLYAFNGAEIRLVANLPARDWRSQKDALAVSLTGRYTVQHHRGFLSGMVHNFSVGPVIVLPEGAAAYFGAIWRMDWVDGIGKGTPEVRNAVLGQGTCRVIDVGDTTVNVVTMRDQEYIDNECFTRDLGLHRANSEILAWARNKYEGLELSLPELEDILRQADPAYMHGTTKIDFAAKKDERYALLAGQIAADMQAQLHTVTHHVLLSGGGCVALADYLTAVFSRQSNVVYDVWEAQWLNALGMQVMVGLSDADAAA